MGKTAESKNKALVLEAFDTLFNSRDCVATEKDWSPTTSNTAHIAPDRKGLLGLIKSLPPTLKYEPGTIVAEGPLLWCTDDFRTSASLLSGLRRISFASRMAFWGRTLGSDPKRGHRR
jgi:hypothetical protein